MIGSILVLVYVVGFIVLATFFHKKLGPLDGSQVFDSAIWPILFVVLGLFWLWTLTPSGKEFMSDVGDQPFKET